jgi:shikimate kinase/3-dehydroquinate synthase
MLWAAAASGDYPVFVGDGLLDGSLWPLDRSASRGFVITDSTVGALHGAELPDVHGRVAIAPGEQHKSLTSAEDVWTALAAAGLTRADHVIALGGGVVGDLAGFCAATYQRGVPVVQVPTTLVAQVDSAYGGKTGVDIPGGKNYVGVYHQPAGVVVDPSALATLPDPERAAGYSEVLKTALIAGGELWDRVAAGEPVDERMIVACARTKLGVVAADERDGGARQLLNLGHTIGHAIEAVTGFARLRHGEAVGLGLLAALRLSGQADLRDEVAELLRIHGLPVTLDGVDAEAVLAATLADKKRTGEHVPYVLVDAPGRVRTGAAVPVAEQLAAIEELMRT